MKTVMVKNFVKGKVYKIKIEEIEFGINPKKFNKKNKEHVKEVKRLAELIKVYGQLQPIDVTPYYKIDKDTIIIGSKALEQDDWEQQEKKFLRLDGERRSRAMKDILDLKEIKALVLLNLSLKNFIDAKWITCAKKVEINAFDMALAVKEFIEQHPELKNPFKRLSELTGYSQTFFKSRYNINFASKPLKKMIEKGNTKSNVMTEIENNIKSSDKDLETTWRKIAESEHVKQGRKKSTLIHRFEKPILNRINEEYSVGKITKEEAKEQGVAIIKYSNKLYKSETIDIPDFALYEREVRIFLEKIKRWEWGTDKDKQRHEKLAVLFSEIEHVWDVAMTEIYPRDRRGWFGGAK